MALAGSSDSNLQIVGSPTKTRSSGRCQRVEKERQQQLWRRRKGRGQNCVCNADRVDRLGPSRQGKATEKNGGANGARGVQACVVRRARQPGLLVFGTARGTYAFAQPALQMLRTYPGTGTASVHFIARLAVAQSSSKKKKKYPKTQIIFLEGARLDLTVGNVRGHTSEAAGQPVVGAATDTNIHYYYYYHDYIPGAVRHSSIQNLFARSRTL